MKKSKLFFFLYFILIISSNIYAQGSLLTPEQMRTKYAVPESPAFTILNISPSNILKPSSVKEIALAASDFLGENERISLPESFAIEFSPGLLINGKKLTQTEYDKNHILYRTRFSIATNRKQGESLTTDLGFGIRITLRDDSDFRTNKKFIDDAQKCTDSIISFLSDLKIKLVTEGKISKTATIDEVEKSPEAEAIVDSISQIFTQSWPIDKWSEKNWNADISEIAIAVKTTSKDSLASNLKLSKLAFWFSSAYRLKNWGQFLFGAFGNYEKNFSLNKYLVSGSLGLRLYIGTNAMKFYLETQGSVIQDKNPEWLFNSGFELRVQDNIWAEFTVGLKKGNEAEKGSLVTDFKLNYGI